jgi:hypothetical protein
MSFLYMFFTFNCLICSILKKTTNMACQTPQDLDLYPASGKKEMKLDIGHKGAICRTIKSMRQWFVCLTRTFSTTYYNIRRIICGQHTQQIRMIEFNSWGSSIIHWDLCLRISIPSRWLSTKSGQIIKAAWSTGFKMSMVQLIILLSKSFTLLDYFFSFNTLGNKVLILCLQFKELDFHSSQFLVLVLQHLFMANQFQAMGL